MKNSKTLLGSLCLSAFLIIGIVPLVFSQEIVRAKIGIELISGNTSKRAKVLERIKPGQNFRIHVIPEKDSHVYVIHTDHNIVTLLNHSIVSKSSSLVLPSGDNNFQIDGLSKKESFTVICSQGELSNVQNLLNSKNVPYSKWTKLEKTLLEISKLDLSEKSDKPFAMAGNVRGTNKSRKGNPGCI